MPSLALELVRHGSMDGGGMGKKQGPDCWAPAAGRSHRAHPMGKTAKNKILRTRFALRSLHLAQPNPIHDPIPGLATCRVRERERGRTDLKDDGLGDRRGRITGTPSTFIETLI